MHDMQETRAVFKSYPEWVLWRRNNNNLFCQAYLDEITEVIHKNGLTEPLTNYKYPPGDVVINGINYRETIRAGRHTSRTRAVLTGR